jgi:hypothetical protein
MLIEGNSRSPLRFPGLLVEIGCVSELREGCLPKNRITRLTTPASLEKAFLPDR